MPDTAANYLRIKKNMEEILVKSGRKADDALLIAVSKTKPIELMQPVYDAGCRDFGENHVQEIVDKYDKMPSDIRWHMIGHLQTNKVKYIVGKVELIHSCDSLKLAEEISRQSVKAGVVSRVLIEVNVSGEASKSGVTPEATE
jgi:pyridoxal phosphate enzyme (YggS family)